MNSFFLKSDGSLWSMGYNHDGQLGDGTIIVGKDSPVPVSGGLQFAELSAGDNHTCGLSGGGAAYCWGGNLYAQLGDGSRTASPTPAATTGGLTFSHLVAGDFYTCGLWGGGTASCWGSRLYGQLGDGLYDGSPVSVAVAPFP